MCIRDRMKVIPGKSLNIILQEDTETLEEVVVVGYGVQKKSDAVSYTHLDVYKRQFQELLKMLRGNL